MRTQKSCMSCHRRKKKCDLSYPCSRCIKIGVYCEYLSQKGEEAAEGVSAKDFERLNKKWSNMEELLENYKNMIKNPLESNTTSSSISATEVNNEMPEIKRDSVKIHCSSPQALKLRNTKQELLDIYFKYHHPVQPFLHESRVRSIIHSQDLGDQTLISAICAIAIKIYNYLKHLPLLDIDDNPYYQHTRKLLSKKKEPSLSVLQAMILLVFMEMGHSSPFKAFCLSTEAIKMGQVLGLHNLNVLKSPSELTEAEIEAIKSWVHCLSIDILTSLFHSKPPHNPNNESPLDITFIKDLRELYKHIIPTRKEKEYLFIHLFHHMIKVKSSTFWDNDALQSGDYDTKEICKKLIELTEGMKLIYSENLIQTEDEILNTIHDITIEDDVFMPNFVLATFKLILNLHINFFIYKAIESENEDSFLLFMEHYSQARLDSIKLCKLLTLTEERYDGILSKDFNKVIYGSHFFYCLGLEIAILCHQSDSSVYSKKFISKCQEKQQEFSTFWPLIKNPLTKSRMMEVHIPDFVGPLTPDHNS